MFRHRHILSVDQFNRDDIAQIFQCAQRAKKILLRKHPCMIMDGKILYTMIFGTEGSTRSLPSFASAMMRMGGRVLNINADVSSYKKGESLQDTVRVLSGQCDAFVMRHPENGAARIAADASSVPVLNGGDGTDEHPTQALLDLFTIQQTRKTPEGITIAMVNDLRYGRTVHSLAKILALYAKVKFIFIAHEQLQMPAEIVDMLKSKGHDVRQTADFEAIREAHVIYMTRIQRERMNDETLYNLVKDLFILDAGKIRTCQPDVVVMHPLPRLHEIATDVDGLPNACYFEQADNGIPIRMALLALLLGKATELPPK